MLKKTAHSSSPAQPTLLTSAALQHVHGGYTDDGLTLSSAGTEKTRHDTFAMSVIRNVGG